MNSLTLTKNVTASLPSSRRWSYVSARNIICDKFSICFEDWKIDVSTYWSDLNFAIYGNWLVFDRMQTQHTSLRKIDDRSSHERAENASIADCEGTSSHVFDGQFVVPSLLLSARVMTTPQYRLTFLLSSAIVCSMPIMSKDSAFRTTGVTRPFGVATATLMST